VRALRLACRFRKLFVLLSSYTYVNRLERMPTL
jgi:hypothetical protein